MTDMHRSAETDAIEHYAQGLDFAADVAHAEARWQTELAMRNMRERAKHRYAAERASEVEAAIRGVAAVTRPYKTKENDR